MNGIADCTGPAVQLGAEEKYFPCCFHCYRASLMKAQQMPADAEWLTAEGYNEKVTLNEVRPPTFDTAKKGLQNREEGGLNNKENGPPNVFTS